MSPMHFMQQPRRWLKAITDYRVSITVGPELLARRVVEALNDGEAEDLDLSTVRELYCGAEPIRADTLARFELCTAPLGFDVDSDDSLLWDGRGDALRRRKTKGAPVAHDRP